MQSPDELEALGRIIFIIKAHKQLQKKGKVDIDTYLCQELSIQDWLLWQDLRAEEIAIRDKEEMLAIEQFELLLKRYKRAGYEYHQFWLQCQHKPTSVD